MGFHSADVNADGILDLVSLENETFVVSLGQGNGTFIPGPTQTLGPSWTWVLDSAMGDLNGDGKPDLVYSADNSFIGTAVLLNQGNGNFGPVTKTWHVSPGSDDVVGPVVLGDFDANGTLDIGTSRRGMFLFAGSKYRKQVFFDGGLNSGNGVQYSSVGQTLEDYIEEGNARAQVPITGGDFNGDGKFDILVSRGAFDALQIYFSQGGGTFSAATTLPKATSLVVTDLNGDGYVDITGFGADGNFRVWLNDGTGAFASGVTYPDVNGPIKAVDMDGDGTKDLVFPSASTTVGVVLNQGNGTFGPRQDYASPVSIGRLVVGDWNNDGRVDVAVQGASLAILLNTCVP